MTTTTRTTAGTTTRGPGRSHMWFHRPGGALALGALAVALGAVGCGSSSGNESIGPGEKFLGRWELDTVPSTFNITCASGTGGPFAVWAALDFEHGVLTDLSEESGNCPPQGIAFNSDSKGTTLAAVVPDPYSSTGGSPACDIPLGADSSGNPEDLILTFSNLTFTLLSSPSGQAPSGLLSGSASGILTVLDITTLTSTTLDTCTYSGTSDRYHQMTRP